MPVLEAMVQGAPVVTSAGTSTEEVAGGAAVLVDPFDVDSIAGGDNAHFRVVATDGVNIGFDESAAVDVPNKAPMAYVSGPADGTVALPDQLLVFNGGASDLEDGSIDDAGLTWTSDRDGELGEGALTNVILPLFGSSVPTKFPPCTVNHRRPRLSKIGVCGSRAAGSGILYSVTLPVLGSNRPRYPRE